MAPRIAAGRGLLPQAATLARLHHFATPLFRTGVTLAVATDTLAAVRRLRLCSAGHGKRILTSFQSQKVSHEVFLEARGGQLDGIDVVLLATAALDRLESFRVDGAGRLRESVAVLALLVGVTGAPFAGTIASARVDRRHR